MNKNLIGASLPFAFALVLQLSSSGVRAFSLRATRLIWKETPDLDAPIVRRGVDLSVYVYSHLSFVFSILISSVSCIAYTIMSEEGPLAGIGAAAFIAILPFWITKWQGLTAQDLRGRRGLPMRICAIAMILLQWSLVILAQRGW